MPIGSTKLLAASTMLLLACGADGDGDGDGDSGSHDSGSASDDGETDGTGGTGGGSSDPGGSGESGSGTGASTGSDDGGTGTGPGTGTGSATGGLFCQTSDDCGDGMCNPSLCCDDAGYCIREDHPTCGGFVGEACPDSLVCVMETCVADGIGHCFTEAEADAIIAGVPGCWRK